jgi:hypothetical protein
LEELFDELLKDSLDGEARNGLSQIHPTFMGGEYVGPTTNGPKYPGTK